MDSFPWPPVAQHGTQPKAASGCALAALPVLSLLSAPDSRVLLHSSPSYCSPPHCFAAFPPAAVLRPLFALSLWATQCVARYQVTISPPCFTAGPSVASEHAGGPRNSSGFVARRASGCHPPQQQRDSYEHQRLFGGPELCRATPQKVMPMPAAHKAGQGYMWHKVAWVLMCTWLRFPVLPSLAITAQGGMACLLARQPKFGSSHSSHSLSSGGQLTLVITIILSSESIA